MSVRIEQSLVCQDRLVASDLGCEGKGRIRCVGAWFWQLSMDGWMDGWMDPTFKLPWPVSWIEFGLRSASSWSSSLSHPLLSSHRPVGGWISLCCVGVAPDLGVSSLFQSDDGPARLSRGRRCKRDETRKDRKKQQQVQEVKSDKEPLQHRARVRLQRRSVNTKINKTTSGRAT